MQIDPTQTQSRDWTAVGQRRRSHNADIAQQHTATPTASATPTRPRGPVGLQINVSEIALIPSMTTATNRHVVC